MKCSGCGAWNDDGSSSCRACGSPLKARPYSSRQPQYDAPAYQPAYPQPYQQTYEQPWQQTYQAPPPGQYPQYPQQATYRRYSPGVALVLAIIVPGLGHLYMNDFTRGLLFLIVCLVLWFVPFGIVVMIAVYLYQIFDAYHMAERGGRRH